MPIVTMASVSTATSHHLYMYIVILHEISNLVAYYIFYISISYKHLGYVLNYLCLAPEVTIEFGARTFTTDEDNGTVTVNLARRTGTLSDNITVCINVTMIMDSAVIQRMYEYK